MLVSKQIHVVRVSLAVSDGSSRAREELGVHFGQSFEEVEQCNGASPIIVLASLMILLGVLEKGTTTLNDKVHGLWNTRAQ